MPKEEKNRKARPKDRTDVWKTMCLAKRRFATEDQARDVGRRFGQRPYFCPHCSGFHNTSKSQENAPKVFHRVKKDGRMNHGKKDDGR